MKITELKDWGVLTKEEQARLRDVYQVDAEDNLPESFTRSSDNPEEVKPVNLDSPNITINAESVVVNKNPEEVEANNG